MGDDYRLSSRARSKILKMVQNEILSTLFTTQCKTWNEHRIGLVIAGGVTMAVGMVGVLILHALDPTNTNPPILMGKKACLGVVFTGLGMFVPGLVWPLEKGNLDYYAIDQTGTRAKKIFTLLNVRGYDIEWLVNTHFLWAIRNDLHRILKGPPPKQSELETSYLSTLEYKKQALESLYTPVSSAPAFKGKTVNVFTRISKTLEELINYSSSTLVTEQNIDDFIKLLSLDLETLDEASIFDGMLIEGIMAARSLEPDQGRIFAESSVHAIDRHFLDQKNTTASDSLQRATLRANLGFLAMKTDPNDTWAFDSMTKDFRGLLKNTPKDSNVQPA